MKDYLPIIGLEVHIELKTDSKMFCACLSDHFGKKPNTQTCPVCLGLPGALPYMNQKAVEYTIMMGLSFGCKINNYSKFDRKHYFYPDLPKAFQTSQYDLPFCMGGEWVGQFGEKVGITRIHLEEDTAKLVHESIAGKKKSLIDFNRSGVPLMELVTEPHFTNSEEVVNFLKEIRLIVRYLGISDAEMQKGSMRLEANISMKKINKNSKIDIKKIEELPDYKVELKNINSFRFLKSAIDAELERQRNILRSGKKVAQETRGYNEKIGVTFSQRSKEEAKDYRYFPEPDLPPIQISDMFVDSIKKSIPELPRQVSLRLKKDYDFSDNFIEYIVSDQKIVEYFDKAMRLSQSSDIGPKTIADMIVNKKAIDGYPEPELLLKKLASITKKDYADQTTTVECVQDVIQENTKAVNDYRDGKIQVIGFLIGMVQKKLSGKGDVKSITDFLKKELEK